MHPQTLRLYEAKGLVRPRRTPGGTRLYSERDLARLKQIQRLSGELGLTLPGIEHVLGLEDVTRALRDRVARARVRARRPARAGGPGRRRRCTARTGARSSSWEPPRGEIVRRQPYKHPRPQKD